MKENLKLSILACSLSNQKMEDRKQLALLSILKHLREFVQSDWFLPMFISHDRDTAHGALGMFHSHAPGPGLIHQNTGFYFNIERNRFFIINYFWSKFALIFESV